MSGEAVAKKALTEINENQNFFIGRVGTYHTV